jgi:hypothetical protein
MKRTELVKRFREAVDDEAQPYLWSDAEVGRYLDDACKEAAVRARLIRDATTATFDTEPVCEIDVVANTHTYQLHPTIFDVERAKLDGDTCTLKLTSTEEMDRESPGWDSLTGSPKYLLIDHQGIGLSARLVPEPKKNDTLRLTVYRTPLKSVNSVDDEPEIPPRFHEHLVDWMIRCAYLKRDAETLDEPKAKDAEVRFTVSFGIRVDANVQRKHANRHTKTVMFMDF